MPKVKLTKTELKREKESLKRFRRYLPMLQLKKRQLQQEIAKVRRNIAKVSNQLGNLRNSVINWVDVFAEEVGLGEILALSEIKTRQGNIAGVDIPVFSQVVFNEKSYDLLTTPLWVDKAVEACKETITLRAQLLVLHKQVEILRDELRIVTQRVNLFEKVMIPQSLENIRVIRIYLGDMQTAEVVRGKIAKGKLEKRKAESFSLRS